MRRNSILQFNRPLPQLSNFPLQFLTLTLQIIYFAGGVGYITILTQPEALRGEAI
jgi:hypothetical protein